MGQGHNGLQQDVDVNMVVPYIFSNCIRNKQNSVPKTCVRQLQFGIALNDVVHCSKILGGGGIK